MTHTMNILMHKFLTRKFLLLLGICSSILFSYKVDAASFAETIGEIVALGEHLLDAAKNNDVTLARNLLKDGADVNYKCNDEFFSENKTALIWASRSGHKEVVQMLLNFEGINVNAADRFGWTALMFASLSGHKEVVQMLLNVEGINVNAADKYGYTALMLASHNGRKEVIQMLLNVIGIDVNAADTYGWTTLICASLSGHNEVVQMLLKVEGINVNAADKNGNTALMWASFYGYKEIVTMIEMHQDNINSCIVM